MDLMLDNQPHVNEEPLGLSKVEYYPCAGGMEIILAQDISNNSQIHLVSHRVSQKRGEIFSGIYGVNKWQMVSKELPLEKIDRLGYCTEDLLLSDAHAVFLALDTDEDLEQYQIGIGGVTPTLISVMGESSSEKGGRGVGKSTQAACLSVLTGLPILDFEPLYEERASLYADELKKNNWQGGYSDAVKIIDAMWNGKKTKSSSSKVKTLNEILKEQTDFFKSNPNRPTAYICDMSGEPGKVVGSKGEVISTRRKYDVFDLFGRESCELPLFTTRPLIVEASTGYKQMDRKLEWMKGEIEKELKP